MNATRFLEILISVSAQAALLVTITHWLSRAARTEESRCRLWAACHALLLGLVVVAAVFPHPRLWAPWSQLERPLAAALVTMEMRAGQVLFWVWLCGVIASLSLLVWQFLQMSIFLRTCRPVAEDWPLWPEFRNLISSTLTQRRRNVRDIRLLMSPRLASPFCWQLHRPVIVLPEYLLRLSPMDVQFIVRHELAHLRTGHPLHLFLQRLVEVLLWFQPMVWWSSQQSQRVREFACDDASIRNTSEISGYLRALLAVVEHASLPNEPSAGVLAFGRGCNLMAQRARRLARLTTDTNPSRQCLPDRLAFGVLIFSVLALLGVWLPVDVLATPRSVWSPWPQWSARVLHDCGVPARDFEVYDARLELHELLHGESHPAPIHAAQ